jgi:hypothetical protein
MGRHGRSAITALAVWLAFDAAASANPPERPPAIFVSPNYALTFRAPSNVMICPLAKDWVGSDHGTVLFLASPGDCGGVGFPSSSRNFSANAPRIEVYYQYWLDDPPSPPPSCRRPVGALELIGKARPLCRQKRGGMIAISASAGYTSDGPTWVQVSLLTTPSRLRTDMAMLKQVAASVEPCRQKWSTNDGRSGVFGTGKPCPADGRFF